jgi:quinone-modifying oxidoreductase, subunit QmoC
VTDFLDYLESESGQPISRCFQCKKCSGGCPVSTYTEIMPHQVVRLTQMGQKEQLMASPGIWFCTGCKTCKVRCPNGIDISAVLDVIKGQVLKQGSTQAPMAAFHTSFLNSVERHGRVFELGMELGYKIRTKTYTEDAGLGIKMFRKAKLSLLPHRVSGRKQVKELFKLQQKGGRADD